MAKEQGNTAVLVRPKERALKKPSRWKVIFHNDDVTTMDFVVWVLMTIFGKTTEEAVQIMLKVHHEGRGVAGVYCRDLAETKAAETKQAAIQNNFPLVVTVEEEI